MHENAVFSNHVVGKYHSALFCQFEVFSTMTGIMHFSFKPAACRGFKTIASEEALCLLVWTATKSRHAILDTLRPAANKQASLVLSSAHRHCPHVQRTSTPPRQSKPGNLPFVSVCFQSVGKNILVLCFGRYSMFFSPFVTTRWIWYTLILVVFRRLGLRLFGLLRNQDPAKDQEWADKIRSSMQKFRLVLDKEGGFCIGNAVSLADVHCGPFLYRLSAARKHLVLLALGWFCAVLTHVDSLFQEATLLGRSKFI